MRIHNLTIECRIELQVVAEKAAPGDIERLALEQLDELLAERVRWNIAAGPASLVEPPDPIRFMERPYVLQLKDGKLTK